MTANTEKPSLRKIRFVTSALYVLPSQPVSFVMTVGEFLLLCVATKP
jgi:hypothetical protein